VTFPANGIPGIDVSHYQGVVDWVAVAASGEQFAYAKATESVSVSDLYFHDNWAAIKSAGLLRGAYHFFHPDKDPAAQAQFFLAKLAAANGGSPLLAPGDLPATLDLETTGGRSPADILAAATVWLQAVAAATGRQPLLYTFTSFWRNTLGNPKTLSNYPLWIAQYSPAPPPQLGGWNNYTFWQFTPSTVVAGIGKPADGDSFNGTSTDLQALAGL
jgi:lysozyme